MARVLVVDDDYAIRDMLITLIEEETDYDVASAGNGQEALDVLHASDVDAVVCDINMPVMNGYDLVRAMRADPRLERTPIIMASAGVFLERMDPRVDVDVLLEKPFEINALLACLAYVLASVRAGGRKVRVTRRHAMNTLNHMLRPAERHRLGHTPAN